MPIIKVANATVEIVTYKFNINGQPSDLNRLEPSQIAQIGGNYPEGTAGTVWWKRGDGVDVNDCRGPGCSPGDFVMPNNDVGIAFGKDLDRFPEQIS
ncbi:hypothetical protein ACO0LD_22950 [Undibacterium sp. Ji83W]|uniref:hypothetical protein n=1 Tax=Undibacterium sp. Ji83W TaxID=3413043 RepID=UPI003BF1C92C